MSSPTYFGNIVRSISEQRISDDISASQNILKYVESIPIGAKIVLPTSLTETSGFEGRPKERGRAEVKYRVVEKNNRMIVCERRHGYRECFTYADLLVIASENGGIKTWEA